MKMRGGLGLGGILLAGAIVSVPSVASAQPEMQEATDTDQDATITLRVRTAGIIDDPLLWCEVEIDVIGTEVAFTEGDTVLVEFSEDDVFFNDILWSTMHTITAAEATANEYSEVFDCSAPAMADGIGDLEFFAEAEVTKDLCGLGCFYDRPTTSNMAVEGLEDDELEEDDGPADAGNVMTGTTQERIARDEDWVRIVLQEPGEVEADLEFMTACGAVDAVLVNEADELLAEIEPGTDSGVVSATDLPAGVYFLQIQPADPGDYNFYDLTVDVNLTPGATTGDDSAGSDSGGSSSDSASGGSASDSGSGASASASASDGSAGSGDSDGSDGGSSDTDLTGGRATGDEGCGCRHRDDAPHPGWLLLALAALRRRRHRA
jgi:MYXO-CTERM domain-containing protein